jgi:hypothetical protein
MNAFEQARALFIEEQERPLAGLLPLPEKLRRIEDAAELEKLRAAGLKYPC